MLTQEVGFATQHTLEKKDMQITKFDEQPLMQ